MRNCCFSLSCILTLIVLPPPSSSSAAVLNLDFITENPWVIQYVSSKRGDNIDGAVEFLVQHSHSADEEN